VGRVNTSRSLSAWAIYRCSKDDARHRAAEATFEYGLPPGTAVSDEHGGLRLSPSCSR